MNAAWALGFELLCWSGGCVASGCCGVGRAASLGDFGWGDDFDTVSFRGLRSGVVEFVWRS